jgi:replicative DNA helicase
MDREELQSIILAYLSGVNESHILTGQYDLGELARVKLAAKIMQKYSGYLLIEEISDPNLVNIESTIKKYATIDNIKYCFFDYIHTTASMLSQFQKNNLNEATILMMMANQLKQLAKDYGIFIFSATQVNMSAMDDDGSFKNEMSIRGSKAVADKADFAYVMSKIGSKTWNSIVGTLKQGAREGLIKPEYLDEENKPTHIIDIYKNRRGRYKNVRIWTKIDLGSGYRKDLFITTADNQPLSEPIDLFNSAREEVINYRDYMKEG